MFGTAVGLSKVYEQVHEFGSAGRLSKVYEQFHEGLVQQ